MLTSLVTPRPHTPRCFRSALPLATAGTQEEGVGVDGGWQVIPA
jgi:hypothetical protein